MEKSYIEICLDNKRFDDLIGVTRVTNLFKSIGVNIDEFIEAGYVESPYDIDGYGDSCNRFTCLFVKSYIYAAYEELQSIKGFNFNKKDGLDNGLYKIKNTDFLISLNKREMSMSTRQKVKLMDLMDLRVDYLNKLNPSETMFDYCTHVIGKKRIAKELGITLYTLNNCVAKGLIELEYHQQSKFYLLDRKKIEIYRKLLNETLVNIDKEL